MGKLRRIDVLATPKQLSPGYIEDRRSVYWVDRVPSPVKSYDTYWTERLTQRQLELVRNKSIPKEYTPDKPSPIWKVPLSALSYPEKERLAQLAQYKKFHQSWTPAKSPFTTVSKAAKSTEPTERLGQLAKPKTYGGLPIKKMSEWDWGEWSSDVKSLKNYTCSSRVDQLAEPKATHEKYTGNRSAHCFVSKGAKNAEPSARHLQLSRPKTRNMLDADYDPYKVTLAAKHAVASPRVTELCAPIPRKVRAKKP